MYQAVFRQSTAGATVTCQPAARTARYSTPAAARARAAPSYRAPSSCFVIALHSGIIPEHLPNGFGRDLCAGKRAADPSLFQHQHPVGGQADAFQDVGGKEQRAPLPVSGHEPVKSLGTLEIQAVDGFIQ